MSQSSEVIVVRGVFQMRGGSSDNLRAVNPVPVDRELMIETDTGRVKCGDGIHCWTELPYVSAPRNSVSLVLGADDIERKSIRLPEDCGTCLDVFVNGLLAEYGSDYEINGETMSWSGLALDGLLQSGDRISIKYERK